MNTINLSKNEISIAKDIFSKFEINKNSLQIDVLKAREVAYQELHELCCDEPDRAVLIIMYICENFANQFELDILTASSFEVLLEKNGDIVIDKLINFSVNNRIMRQMLLDIHIDEMPKATLTRIERFKLDLNL
jgi:hypothetical protein